MGIWISHRADEKQVFKRFVETQPSLSRRRWRYDGAHHGRPDFVLLKEKTGVELSEWLDPAQTKTARELERFEKEIDQRAKRKGLTAFIKSLKPSSNTRYSVVLRVRRVPSRHCKAPVIEALLDFLRAVKKPESDRDRKFGVGFGREELPEDLKPVLFSIRISEARSPNLNVGMLVDRGGSFNPNDAVKVLLAQIKDKLVTKRVLYSKTKAQKGLRRLWLVVHYGRGLNWNSPYDGLGLACGRPLDEETSRQIIVERARQFIGEIGAGPFDRVFLLFNMMPGFECMSLFP